MTMSTNWKDLLLRFLLGGSAVVLSYAASVLLPWKALGGIFATFPAVMIVAVLMVGWAQGSARASEIARGSVYGMAGCAVCVVAVLYFMKTTGLWWLSLGLGLVCWYLSAFLIYKVRRSIKSS
ncbi:DUF3147 family protein [Paenibacillus mucilaginosus]|uniref:DUF3147 family protein n=1 Tax=Paenibacillus mucilaginosus (strain KNP414) TaxID=1036673 RepID=F8FL53_PAEMK|nr:DUF3147 family protein [Paenibacillus mucilaginosus]AEI39972.1 hypothetical protein KNP414_01408 [Paenibacillus mucilaginosus KNP414]MCG7216394.1 DUF3147 family protein [Paenibacillus mucilaginosus]WDM29228.1 DUF3147 family protein [Paenibacillus mucilaginosus]